MILCKHCNAVRSRLLEKSCGACGAMMAASEVAAAMMEIPARQFFDNVLFEVIDARRQFPENVNLIGSIRSQAVLLDAQQTRNDFRMMLVKICALAVRVITEGDKGFPETAPSATDPLADMIEEIENAKR